MPWAVRIAAITPGCKPGASATGVRVPHLPPQFLSSVEEYGPANPKMYVQFVLERPLRQLVL